MQAALKLFEVIPQGHNPNMDTQTIAVKFPSADTQLESMEAADFMGVLTNLMALPADQLQTSLDQLDWVALEGTAEEMVPLIDLTDPNGKTNQILSIVSETLPRRTSMVAHMQFGGEAAKAVSSDHTQQVVAKEPSNQLVEKMNMPVVNKLTDLNAQPKAAPVVQTLQQSTDPNVANLARQIDSMNPNRQETLGHTLQQKLSAMREDTPRQATRVADVQVQGNPVKSEQGEQQAPNADAHGLKAANSAKDQIGARFVASKPLQSVTQETGLGVGKGLTTQIQVDAEPSRRHAIERHVVEGEKPFVTEKSNSSGNITNLKPAISPDEIQPAGQRLSTVSNKGAESAEAPEKFPMSKELQTDVVRQIVQRMTMRSDGLQSQMNIKLKPEVLGNLRMQIVTEGQQVAIRMTAESHAVKEIIEQHVQFLKSELQHHGLSIDKFDVSVDQDNDGWKNGQQQTASQQASHQNRHGQRRGFLADEGEDQDEERSPLAASRETSKQSNSEAGEVDFFA